MNNADLAESLNSPKRRIYDVIAILKAADLISTSRDGAGTRIYWNKIEQELQMENLDSNASQSFKATRIKVTTDGSIYKVANQGDSVEIELDESAIFSIEPIE